MLSMYRAAASLVFQRDQYAGDEDSQSKCLTYYFFCPLVTNLASQFPYDNVSISHYHSHSLTILYCACHQRICIRLQLVLHSKLAFYTRPLSAINPTYWMIHPSFWSPLRLLIRPSCLTQPQRAFPVLVHCSFLRRWRTPFPRCCKYEKNHLPAPHCCSSRTPFPSAQRNGILHLLQCDIEFPSATQCHR